MRIFRCFLILVSLSGALQAQIFWDGFFEDVPGVIAPGSTITLDVNDVHASRQLVAEASSPFGLMTEVLNNLWIVDGSLPSGEMGSGSATANYLGFDVDLGENVIFKFTVSNVVGNPLLVLQLGSSSVSPGTMLSGELQLTPTTSGASYFIDLTTLTGYSPGFLTAMDSLSIFIAGSETFFVAAESIEFVSALAIPEPSASAGLGVALLGWAIWRKRSKQGSRCKKC